MSMTVESIDVLQPDDFVAHGYPHETWARLRREDPVHYVERKIDEPYWAITRYQDLVDISRRPETFESAPRLFMSFDTTAGEPLPIRMMLNMDPPEHGDYRTLVNKSFTPRAMKSIIDQVDGIATDILDTRMGKGDHEGEIDFVQSVSALLPIWVIAEMLGVPRSDWETLFDWTNRIVGSADPEYQEEGKDAEQTRQDARIGLFQYFNDLTEARRLSPRDDLVSALIAARIDGEPLPKLELMSYYMLLVVAGNETTRNATTSGLLALIEHPHLLRDVQANPRLVKPLVEEILRWSSPVIHFCRTPNEDVEIGGKKIHAGERLVLFYPSANRDESVFDAPNEFRLDRTPNRHVAFGIGEHVCLGAHVARLELQVIFRHLIERLDHVELAGPIERLRSTAVGGIKHMPIRYGLRTPRP